MATITLEIPDDLLEQLSPLQEQLPELLRQCLQPAFPSQVYRYTLDFLTSQPTPEQIAAFRPTPEMQTRLQTLLARSYSGELTPTEQRELDEYEQIEHLIVMLKTGNLPYLTANSAS
jgi:hypothetical protein